MKLVFIVIGALTMSLQLHAQKISIRGYLRDSTGGPMPSGTVLLLNPADSSLLNFTPSDHEGMFLFHNIPSRTYLLRVSYVGFQTYAKLVDPKGSLSADINVGEIIIHESSRTLDEVIIVAEQAPVVIKRDTIEFNASSFKTKDNDVVEELLKKLPGVEVDNDGTIRAQGQQVERVTVDGKPFFGDDPRLATRQLPADAISKVQVFDKKSDQAMFTGIDDGQREKTINLQLKEERRKGMFGAVSGGVGSDSRATAKLSLNRFQKDNQFSVLGQANNINERGFGIDDYMNFTGGSQQMMRGRGMRVEISDDGQGGVPLNFGSRPSGIMTTYAAGANFNRTLGKNTEVGASYFFNQVNHNLESDLLRENFFEDGQLDFQQHSVQNNRNFNHRAHASVEQRIDSMNSIKLDTDFNYNATEGLSQTSSSNSSPEGGLASASDSRSRSTGSSEKVNSSLLWRHRFNKRGRTFTTSFVLNMVANDRASLLNALLQGPSRSDSVFQQRTSLETVNTIGSITTTYTEPLGRRIYLEFNYSHRQNRNDFDRKVFDIEEKGEFLSQSMTSSYESVFRYNRGGINFRLNRRDFNVSAGFSVQEARLSGEFEGFNASINRSFTNVLPAVRINQSLGGNRNLEFSYETRVTEPSILELQPVRDISDPLNQYIGNPRLRPSYAQHVRMNYNSFNPLSFVNLFTFVEATVTSDAITMAQSVDEDGIRLSMPVNVDQYQSWRLHGSFGFPIEKLKSRIGLGTNLSIQAGTSIINQQAYKTRQTSTGLRARYDFQHKEWLNFAISANVVRQGVDADLGAQNNQRQFNNTYTSELNLTFLKNYAVSAALEYLHYINKTTDFEQAVPLLNVSLSRFIFKARSCEFKLSAVNLLDKNMGVVQSTGINYIERSVTNTLGRYFMLSFFYSLNRQLNPLGARPSGRIMRIID